MKRKAAVVIAVLAVVLAGCIRFAPPETLSISGATSLADVTGDGKADVLVDNGTSLARLEYCGTGCLQAKQEFSGQHLQLIGDFNGDGIADVLTYDGRTASPLPTYRVLFGGPNGLGNAVTVPPAADPGLAAVGDFNGDGKADLVRVGDVAPEIGRFVVYLGNGLGGFAASTLSSAFDEGETGPVQLLVGDPDGDGRDDLVVAALGMIHASRLGDPTCNKIDTCPYINVSIGSDLLAIGDINGDGRDDLARYQSGNPGSVDFFRSTGTGFTPFPAYRTISVPATGTQIQMGLRDVDDDGKVDFQLNDYVNPRTWWSGTNDGGFPYQAQTDVPLQASGCRNCFGDVNGDGRIDAISGNQLWINTSN